MLALRDTRRAGMSMRVVSVTTLAAAALAVFITPASANIFSLFGGDDDMAPMRPPQIREPVRPRPMEMHRRKLPMDRRGLARAPHKDKADPLKSVQGPFHIVISINDQKLALYANGVVVARSPVSTGVPGHATPTGVFSIIQKRRFHRSNIYSGAPMPFMQRITWSGVALHQGVVPGYPASHGCIRLPAEFAARLWGITKVGARVIIARNEVTPMEVSHPRLFAAKSASPQASTGEPARPLVKVAEAAAPSVHPVEAPRLDAPDTVAALAEPIRGTIAPQDAAADPDTTASVPVAPAETDKSAVAAPDAPAAAPAEIAKASEPPLRSGPVSVFVSRKESKLYVRKGFAPVFETPVTIADPERAIGTHVFTAMEVKDKDVRWTVVSMASGSQKKKATSAEKGSRMAARESAIMTDATPEAVPPASEALERVTIPPAAIDRISELMTTGASFIISDNGLGPETGLETDFIVLTR